MKDIVGRALLKWRMRTLLPVLRGRVLDIGCGTNELVKAHPGGGVGVDVYQWGTVDVVVEDSARLPFENESFDTVSIVAALNHIPNREAVLLESHRVLRPGGRFVMTMIPPVISRVWHAVREPWDADQHERGMVPGEVYGLTRAEVRRLLENAGFSVVSETPFMMRINCMTVSEKRR